jgi:hypothetical protein
MSERFGIRIHRLWRPLFVLFGATSARSYVDVAPECVRIRMGWYRLELQHAHIADWEITSIPWWWGRGWRSNMKDMIALVGVGDPVLKLSLSQRVRTRLLSIPLRLQTVYVSVDDPAGITRALTSWDYGTQDSGVATADATLPPDRDRT